MQNIIFWNVKPMFLHLEKHGFRAFQKGKKVKGKLKRIKVKRLKGERVKRCSRHNMR